MKVIPRQHETLPAAIQIAWAILIAALVVYCFCRQSEIDRHPMSAEAYQARAEAGIWPDEMAGVEGWAGGEGTPQMAQMGAGWGGMAGVEGGAGGEGTPQMAQMGAGWGGAVSWRSAARR